MSGFVIQPFEERHWPGCWSVIAPVLARADTYPYPANTSEASVRQLWLDGKAGIFVALDEATGDVLGTYYIKANQPGRGAHVCNCGYMVAASARGRGIATAMCEHSQQWALENGFRAMQFNFVVASNTGAVRLWQQLGFAIVGTLPGAFDHPVDGFTDAHVMFKSLV